MLEFVGILFLLGALAVAALVVCVVLFALKLIFKIVLLPVKLVGGLLLGLFGLVLVVPMLAVALPALVLVVPAILIVALVGCALFALLAVAWLGFHALAWIF